MHLKHFKLIQVLPIHSQHSITLWYPLKATSAHQNSSFHNSCLVYANCSEILPLKESALPLDDSKGFTNLKPSFQLLIDRGNASCVLSGLPQSACISLDITIIILPHTINHNKTDNNDLIFFVPNVLTWLKDRAQDTIFHYHYINQEICSFLGD